MNVNDSDEVGSPEVKAWMAGRIRQRRLRHEREEKERKESITGGAGPYQAAATDEVTEDASETDWSTGSACEPWTPTITRQMMEDLSTALRYRISEQKAKEQRMVRRSLLHLFAALLVAVTIGVLITLAVLHGGS